MVKARKEGAAKAAPVKAEPAKEGAKHAAALEAAVEYYNTHASQHADESQNWPFRINVANVVNHLKGI
jgi:hypothetical protein